MLTNIKLFCRQKLIDGSGTLKSRDHQVSLQLSGAMRRKFHSSVNIWANKNKAWQYWLVERLGLIWSKRFSHHQTTVYWKDIPLERWKETNGIDFIDLLETLIWRLSLKTFWVSMFNYRIVASTNTCYYSENQLFVQRSQYIRTENPLHKQSEKAKTCH